ncbi:MAG: hypothetical protein HYY16_18185 [Planctomycetes bacterium]|nr:hypothetical protein [Planctomycetota bacterium]
MRGHGKWRSAGEQEVAPEIKPDPTPFDGTGNPVPLVTGNFVGRGGGVSEAIATGLPDGDYKWRARTLVGATPSDWVEYDAGLNPDSTVDISAGGGGGSGPASRDNGNADSWINDSSLCLAGIPSGARVV